MSRKKTILTAALINAALLAALMITALSDNEEEISLTPASVVLEKEEITLPNIVQVEKQNNQSIVKNELKSDNIVHKLPEIVAQKETPSKVDSSLIETSNGNQARVASTIDSSKKMTDWKEVIVKKGDSLDKLAKRYHTTVNEILALNHLPTTLIRTGQVLKIPITKSPAKAEAMYYVVKPGDNPWTIAMKHHIKLEDLLKLNHLDKQKAKKLRPGDKLRIR